MDDTLPLVDSAKLSDAEKKRLRNSHPLYGRMNGEVIWVAYEELGYDAETCATAMDAELEPYDSARVHLASLTREKVEALEARLAGLTVEQRAELPGLQAKRAPVILGGAVAISELMRQTSFSALQASESDLLFGLALTAAASLDGTASPVGWRPEMHALPERPLR